VRLFIGIPLEKKITREIYSLYNKFKNLKNAKFVNKENLHITLKFLGEVDEEKIPLIKNAIDSSVSNFEKFFISTNKISGFPAEKRAKVIWFNVDKNSDKIERIFNSLEINLEKIEFEKEEKKFVPHITIARVKEGANIEFIVKNLNFEFKSEVISMALFQSVLNPDGPVYVKIYEKFLI